MIWFAALTIGLTPVVSGVDTELSELIARLRARDTSLDHIILPFTAEAVDVSKGETRYLETGWYARGPSYWAMEVTSTASGRPVTSRGIWDGTDYRWIPDTNELIPLLIIESGISKPFTAYSPDFFGPWHSHVPIAELLSGGFQGRASIVGKESIASKQCIKVVFDAAPSPVAATYGRPMCLWIDDESLLVMRCEELRAPAELPQSNRRTTLGGETYALGFTWVVDDLQQIRPGLWMPLRGRLLSYLDKGVTVRVDFHLTGAVLGSASVVNSTGEIPSDRWYYVDDRISNTHYSMGPFGKSTLDTLRFGALLLGENPGMHPSDFSDIDIPFHLSSCGPNIVFLLARRFHPRLSLEDILALVPKNELNARITSFDTLVSSLRSFGFGADAANMTLQELRDHCAAPDTWAIVAFEHSRSACVPDHFALARIVGDAVEVTSVPGEAETWNLETFSSRWGGSAVIVRWPAPADVDRPHLGTLIRGSAICLGCIAVVMGVVILRRKDVAIEQGGGIRAEY